MTPANLVVCSLVSKCVMGEMPLRPATSPAQVSRKVSPRLVAPPSPVTTTRLLFMVPGPIGARSSGGAHVGLDEVHRVSDGLDLLGLFVRDRDVEVVLELHDQFDRVERVRAEVLDERGVEI